MKLDEPKSWQCPDTWNPEFDGKWEISCLKKLALEINAIDSNLKVSLDIEDPTCVFFNVFRGQTLIGEAYVNRKTEFEEEPQYSVFFEESEVHSSSTTSCSSALVNSKGFYHELRNT